MFCSDCGTKNSGDNKFCSNCGKALQQQSIATPPPIPPQPIQMPPPPPMPAFHPAPAPRAGGMNKLIYMICAAGGLILGVLLTVWGATDSKVDELLYFSWLPFVPAIVAINVMIYKMWAAIQDGNARTTPGKAVAFMFIPLFSLYWFFQVFYGWAKDYNSYVTRHNLSVPQVSENTFLIYVISSYFCFPVSIVMLFIVISRICDSVNSLAKQ